MFLTMLRGVDIVPEKSTHYGCARSVKADFRALA
jgi:hypothetical protein